MTDWSLPELTPAQRAETHAAFARYDLEQGLIALCCPDCDATWHGKEGDECWWCARALANMAAEQTRMDRERLADLCERISEGDLSAIPRATRLVKAAAGRLDVDAAARQIARAASKAAA